jgi:hypothetical protein
MGERKKGMGWGGEIAICDEMSEMYEQKNKDRRDFSFFCARNDKLQWFQQDSSTVHMREGS